MTHTPSYRNRPERSTGMTLIELMVALAIGAFLMIGAITVFVQSRASFRITESVSRLQENGRFAIDALEADIRMAGFWGLTSRPFEIENSAGPLAANGIGNDACGVNFLIDFENTVAGTNNAYTWPCAAPSPYRAGTDTLVVRRVRDDAVTPAVVANPAMTAPNTLFVMSYRGGPALGQIFAAPAVPADYDPALPLANELHQLVVNLYYVSNTNAIASLAVPSLRVRRLGPGGVIATGATSNEEVMAGVDDMQIQFGLDTDAPGIDGVGTIDRYVNANDALLATPDVEVLAVRIWLRIRAERAERGFTDTVTYQYAGQNFGPFNDGFRRIVVSKTIFLRNSRPVGS